MLKKKKTPLFGGSIPPSCGYCCYNGCPEGQPVCTLRLVPEEEGKCRSYLYNPLMREPKPAPQLRAGAYQPEDFKL